MTKFRAHKIPQSPSFQSPALRQPPPCEIGKIQGRKVKNETKTFRYMLAGISTVLLYYIFNLGYQLYSSQNFLVLKLNHAITTNNCQLAQNYARQFNEPRHQDLALAEVAAFCDFKTAIESVALIKEYQVEKETYETIHYRFFTRDHYPRVLEWMDNLDNVSRDGLLIFSLEKSFTMDSKTYHKIKKIVFSRLSFKENVALAKKMVLSKVKR